MIGEGAAIKRLVDDDLVARRNQCPEGCGDGAHAGRQRQTGSRAFQIGDAAVPEDPASGWRCGCRYGPGRSPANISPPASALLEHEGGTQVKRRRERCIIVHRLVGVMDGAAGKTLIGTHGCLPNLDLEQYDRIMRVSRFQNHASVIAFRLAESAKRETSGQAKTARSSARCSATAA